MRNQIDSEGNIIGNLSNSEAGGLAGANDMGHQYLNKNSRAKAGRADQATGSVKSDKMKNRNISKAKEKKGKIPQDILKRAQSKNVKCRRQTKSSKVNSSKNTSQKKQPNDEV